MFLAAVLAYRYHQEQHPVEDTVDDANDQSIEGVLRTQSAQLLHQARRCYEPRTEDAVIEVDESFSSMSEAAIVTNETGGSLSDVFRDDIRQEWVDAVFGRDFFRSPGYQPKRQGVGLSKIASYVTYQSTIPEDVATKGERVGATLSRIALGLYVRRVERGSEAAHAGVREGSILVDVNGMGFLGEPSKHALERLWQYEGYRDDTEEDGLANPAASSSSSDKEPTHFTDRPVAMKFIKGGELYTVLFLSNPPFGISWAPCGNFALVQRSYSFASDAGVLRGSLVAAVNGLSMRVLDHQSAANEISRLFREGKQIELTLGFTPAAARTGLFDRLLTERKQGKKSPPKEKRKIGEIDGVEVRYHPLEYNLGSLFHGSKKVESKKREGKLSELASLVAAGEAEAPVGLSHSRSNLSSSTGSSTTSQRALGKTYQPCPSLSRDELLRKWDPLDALLFLSQMECSDYDEDAVAELIAKTVETAPLSLLTAMTEHEDGWEVANALILQWVSMLCVFEEDEVEDEDVGESERCKEMAALLLSMSQRSDEFCQRLYFLLRAFTATLEGQKKNDKKDDSTKARLVLLQALGRLRSAQKDLASQLAQDNNRRGEPSPILDRVVLSPENRGEVQKVTITNGSPQKKTKTMFKLFRKKGAKALSSPQAPDRNSTRSSLEASNHRSTPQEAAPRSPSPLRQLSMQLDYLSISSLLENMSTFLLELDTICDSIERSLLKSFSQKIADWALQPWSASKGTALAKVTASMRQSLDQLGSAKHAPLPIVNPIESSEVLSSVESKDCYILPSAHFPILLTFKTESKKETKAHSVLQGKDEFYRTTVQVVAIRGSASSPTKSVKNSNAEPPGLTYSVQGAVAGQVRESGQSFQRDTQSKTHFWTENNSLVFDSRSCWGPPQTLSLRLLSTPLDKDGHAKVSHSDNAGLLHYSSEVGSCWVDLNPVWEKTKSRSGSYSVSCHAQIWWMDAFQQFDDYGDLPDGLAVVPDRLELELRISTEVLDTEGGGLSGTRTLLYKHDDDLRQEMFAIQFFEVCNSLLKSSGLDLKLLTFRCIPVGARRGFIEWVPGSVPLSDICQPFAGSILGSRTRKESDSTNSQLEEERNSLSTPSRAGLMKFQSLRPSAKSHSKDRNLLLNNPIQDFLRSVAYDPDAPYLIRKEVMDNYVKSCAGYCVLTYILGVGDRHLDNLLLHQTGHFFHCDFTFIFGKDPKRYLPVRITEDMVFGMGGKGSDNYAKFVTLAGAAFVALRRLESVRVILSMVRLMSPSALPDLSIHQNAEDVVLAVRDRLRLDLSDGQAIDYMEELIEQSITSKMWIAVDAIHSLGKRF